LHGHQYAEVHALISHLLPPLPLLLLLQIHNPQNQRSLKHKPEHKIWSSHSGTNEVQVFWDVMLCCWVCSCLSVESTAILSSIRNDSRNQRHSIAHQNTWIFKKQEVKTNDCKLIVLGLAIQHS
jgi:hypothetical protein